MDLHNSGLALTDWRRELPALTSRNLWLREPADEDRRALLDLLSLGDATRFGLHAPIDADSVLALIDRARRERAAGVAFSYVIALGPSRAIVGLFQVRQLDLGFETAEWEATLAPSARGTGLFLEAARLVGTFAFTEVGVHRLESRVSLQNGRANGALLKLGAVQEGVLRRSARHGAEFVDQVLWALVRDDWGHRAATLRVH